MPKKVRELKAMLRKAGPVATRKRKSHNLGTSPGRRIGNDVGRGRTGRASVSGARSRLANNDSDAAPPLNHYSMMIQWAHEDKIYMVILPEFENALTHGKTYSRAVAAGQELIESFILWYRQDGKPLPAPMVFDYDKVRSADKSELITT